MSEMEGQRPPDAEDSQKKEEMDAPEKKGFFRAMGEGTLKGGAEMFATIAAASVTDGPVQPAELFDDENGKASYRGGKGEESATSDAQPQKGEERQEERSGEEKQQQKRSEKAAKPGRERARPPARESSEEEQPQQDEQSDQK